MKNLPNFSKTMKVTKNSEDEGKLLLKTVNISQNELWMTRHTVEMDV